MNFAIKSIKFGAVSKGKRQQGFQLATLRPAFVGRKKKKREKSWNSFFTKQTS